MLTNCFDIIQLPQIADPRGNLSFVQPNGALPFEIARCYWIYDVPDGSQRGGHALKHTTELIIALSGSFDAVVDCGDGVEHEVHLCRGNRGLLVGPMCWRSLRNFSTNAVAFVLADTLYSPDDYIFDYESFIKSAGLSANTSL